MACDEYTQTLPSVPTLAITELGLVPPVTKLTFDANGRSTPHGYTVANPGAAASTAVTFNTTDAADPGTPPRPATATSWTPSPVITPDPASTPSTVTPLARVSSSRRGSSNGE